MTERAGSCLCGAIRFAVRGEIQGVGQCHCSQCRKVSGTNGNAVFIVPIADFRWTAGEGEWEHFTLPSGWGVPRCRRCGCPLPHSYDEARVWVPAGLMDDDLGTEIKLHIFCASRADWDQLAKDAPEFDEYPS